MTEDQKQWRADYAVNHMYVQFIYWEIGNSAQFVLNDWIGIAEGAD